MELDDYYCCFTQFRPKLLEVAFSLLKDAYLAEDLVEDTLMTGIKNLSDFQEGSFMKWMKAIMRRRYYKDYCTRKRREEMLGNMTFETIYYMYPADVYSYVSREADKIPEKLKTVFKHARLEGRSLKEISVMLSVPEGTVKSRLARADELIRKAIKENLY
ncbi:MAG: RNA polymerase sigma factor [Bacillota bacterium]